MVETDPDVVAARIAYRTAKYEAARLNGDIEALGHKARQIDNLRYLLISGYYIIPSGHTPADGVANATRGNLNRPKSDQGE